MIYLKICETGKEKKSKLSRGISKSWEIWGHFFYLLSIQNRNSILF